jgi:hypothetical protein
MSAKSGKNTLRYRPASLPWILCPVAWPLRSVSDKVHGVDWRCCASNHGSAAVAQILQSSSTFVPPLTTSQVEFEDKLGPKTPSNGDGEV